ncbi:MAG: hypothetical protein O2782_11080 [bacterium]|nr:hypothetical protein [bacterium]
MEVEGRYDMRSFLSWDGIEPQRYKDLAAAGKAHNQIMRQLHAALAAAEKG